MNQQIKIPEDFLERCLLDDGSVRDVKEIVEILNNHGADCSEQQCRVWLAGETIMPRDIAVLYTAIVNMIFNVSLFIAGDAIMAERKGFSFDPKQLFTPGMVASVLAVFLYAFRIMFPEWILVPLNSFGDMTTPLAMLIIGATLAGYRLKDVTEGSPQALRRQRTTNRPTRPHPSR